MNLQAWNTARLCEHWLQKIFFDVLFYGRIWENQCIKGKTRFALVFSSFFNQLQLAELLLMQKKLNRLLFFSSYHLSFLKTKYLAARLHGSRGYRKQNVKKGLFVHLFVNQWMFALYKSTNSTYCTNCTDVTVHKCSAVCLLQ